MKNASSKITFLLLIAVAMLFAGCTTPLHMAAEKGDIKEMERLIAEGANVNAKGFKPFLGTKPLLHWAASDGNKEVAELLISKGADVNAKDGNGLTPLGFAAVRGHKDIARLLIEKGADVNDTKKWLEEALSEFRGKPAIAMIESLAKEHETAKAKAKEAEAEATEAAFTEAARSYRTATVKPALPEEARKFKVQAEFAVGKKDFEGAASRYKEALAVAPWWPEGRFNRALILGELSRYHDAIKEMKKYLTLVPEAPNARAAQDKIYQWEGELK